MAADASRTPPYGWSCNIRSALDKPSASRESASYAAKARKAPIIRKTIARVAERAALAEADHDAVIEAEIDREGTWWSDSFGRFPNCPKQFKLSL